MIYHKYNINKTLVKIGIGCNNRLWRYCGKKAPYIPYSRMLTYGRLFDKIRYILWNISRLSILTPYNGPNNVLYGLIKGPNGVSE